MKTKNKKGSISPRTVLEILLVVFAAGSVFWGAYFMVGKIMGKSSSQENVELKAPASETASEMPQLDNNNLNGNNENQILELGGKLIIRKGQIAWQDPVDIGDIGLTTKKIYQGCDYDKCGIKDVGSSGIKYIKAGTVSEGEYAGFDVIVVSAGAYETMESNQFFRLLRKDGKIVFLARAEDDYIKSLISAYFLNGKDDKIFDEKTTIAELNFPDKLQGENERQQFVKDQYSKAFFTDAKLKRAFVHPQYGQVWMTDEVKALNVNSTTLELNSYVYYDYISDKVNKGYYDIFGRRGFYFRAPDGTAVAYKLVPDIFEMKDDTRYAVVDAVWNDGRKNEKEFEVNPSGCGSGKYVYDETLEVNPENDLMVVGKTNKGDDLFGYRDTSLAGFSTLYNETYWVKEGKKKKSPEEFLKEFPKVFWKDPFGRVLAFYNAEFLSPAECGKPVIYLYPEKSMEVSVKVKPGNGLSFTDPEYGGGWKVMADENSNLINLSDGKTYPYLFWEGQGGAYYQRPSAGFVVEKDNLSSFFDEKLAKLGLIEKEIADFEEFWVPKMREENKPYYFVTFMSKRFMDLNAPLTIDPQPDTIIRVMMDYDGLDQFKTVPELKIKTPERKGFTAVEWGGMLK